MRRHFFLLILSLGLIPFVTALSGEIKKDTKQLIVGIAANWDSSYVTLTHYERGKLGNWNKVGSWKGRLGRNGLAWGIGFHDIPAGAKMKREGDGRTPAGIFDIGGGAWGYASSIKKQAALPYHKITTRSLWYEDTKSPYYNSFRVIDHEPKTTAEKKAQMRQNDYAHALKLLISHNYFKSQKTPGFGSAIFFHIWRGGGSKATAGCTTMSEANLKTMISFIDPKKKPRFVILPKAEYEKYRELWKLP